MSCQSSEENYTQCLSEPICVNWVIFNLWTIQKFESSKWTKRQSERIHSRLVRISKDMYRPMRYWRQCSVFTSHSCELNLHIFWSARTFRSLNCIPANRWLGKDSAHFKYLDWRTGRLIFNRYFHLLWIIILFANKQSKHFPLERRWHGYWPSTRERMDVSVLRLFALPRTDIRCLPSRPGIIDPFNFFVHIPPNTVHWNYGEHSKDGLKRFLEHVSSSTTWMEHL